MSVDRVALGVLTVASPLLVVCLLLSHPTAQLIFGVVALGFPVALMALGAQRGGRLGPLALPLTGLLLVLEVSLPLLLAFGGRVGDLPWILGLPPGLAIEIYLMTLVPLAITTIAYGLTFEGFTLTEADLERILGAAESAGEFSSGE